VPGVADDQREPAFQHGVDRAPVDPGALHADMGDAVFHEPVAQGLQVIVPKVRISFLTRLPVSWIRTQATTLA
jgi:hypothetical protein